MDAVRCAQCNYFIPVAFLPPGGIGPCPACQRPVVISVFPALFAGSAPKPPALPEQPPAEGEAACFYSPERRATKTCSHCGVLISDLWAAQWGSETVCLKCLDHLREKGADQRFQGSSTLWDNIALALALLPLTFILWWSVVFTAPAAVFIVIRHWNSPRSLVPRGRFRMIVALILGIAEIIGMILGAGALWFGWFKHASR